MTPTREDTPRVSIATLRTQFKPSTYRALTRVTLDHGGVACAVALVTVPAHGSVRGAQRRLVCPRCAKAVLVLGVVEGKGWVCATCGRWRSRDRPRCVSGALRSADGNGSVREDDSGNSERAAATGGTDAVTPGVSQS